MYNHPAKHLVFFFFRREALPLCRPAGLLRKAGQAEGPADRSSRLFFYTTP
jgi:hypothetical protein